MTRIWLLAAVLSFAAIHGRAQNRWQILISTGMLSPEFIISQSPNYTLEGTLLYELPDSTQITFCTGIHHWKQNLGPGGTSFRSVPLLVGAQLPFLSGWISPYLTGELGLEFLSRQYTFEVYSGSELGLYHLVSSNPATESATNFAFRFGVGVAVEVIENLHIDLSTRYERVAYHFDYSYALIRSKGALEIYGIFIGMALAL